MTAYDRRISSEHLAPVLLTLQSFSPWRLSHVIAFTSLYFLVEIISVICFALSNKDIKNLRLTCRLLSIICKLRLDRVFLSASPRNISVFRAIAQHETFRKQIFEIVWDDALLQPLPTGGSRSQLDIAPIPWIPPWADCWNYETFYNNSTDACPLRFWQQCEKNIHHLEARKDRDIPGRPENLAREEMIAARLPLLDSLDYYEELIREQDKNLIHKR